MRCADFALRASGIARMGGLVPIPIEAPGANSVSRWPRLSSCGRGDPPTGTAAEEAVLPDDERSCPQAVSTALSAVGSIRLPTTHQNTGGWCAWGTVTEITELAGHFVFY
jgi:hypothetical protein